MNVSKEDLENRLKEMTTEKEKLDKRLLIIEIIVGSMSAILFLITMSVASYLKMEDYIRFWIIFPSVTAFIVLCFELLKIEQVAGYYECQKCHNKYIPTYFNMLMAPHFGRTRYMKCPECNEKSWNKKAIRK